MCKNIFVADLLRSQFLFELLQTSLTVKNSENGMVEGGEGEWMLGKMFPMDSVNFFFEMKEGYNVSRVKILIFRSVIRSLVFI